MIKRAVIKYIFVLLSTAALCGAEFSGLRPCGAGYAAALVFCGLPAVIVLPAFILFSLAFDFTLVTLLYAVIISAGIFTAAFVSIKLARGKRAAYAVIFALSQAAVILMRGRIGYLGVFVWGVFSVGVLAASVCFLKPVIVRKLRYKFLETELVCGGILLICASLGLSRMRVYGFDAAYIFAAFFVPFAAGVGSLSGAVAVAMCFGSGIALSSLNPAPIAFMAFAALVTSVFSAAPRPLPSLSAAVGYMLASYMFSLPPSWQQCLCFAVGALAFALIPPRVITKVRDSLFAPVTAAAARGVIGRVANETGNSLLGASRIFDDMRLAMEQVPEVAEDCVIEKNVCSTCNRYADCSSRNGFKEALVKMERESAAKGRAVVSEIPSVLSACVNLSSLVSCATETAKNRHEQIIIGEAKKEGRKIVAQQLGLMSGVLRGLGERVKTPARFDSEKEKKIAVELAYRGAAVPEVIVTDDTVSVVIQTDTLTYSDVAAVIGKVLHAPYKYVRGGTDVLPGFALMLFTRAPRFDVAFSVAARAKENMSGDNHSFVHLGGDRFMMALCDGMGSGEAAEKASETAIELVESFFKAGLDSMSAVDCVNRFLALNECERFSTLDVTVIDLNSGDAEIIKLSSPATVIKSDDGVSAISGSSLPMGVFENVSCGHVRRKLRAGDEVIMATDGITDALGSTERFVSAAAAQRTADPHIEAQNILECAVISSGGALRDDGTVLCARLFEKIA